MKLSLIRYSFQNPHTHRCCQDPASRLYRYFFCWSACGSLEYVRGSKLVQGSCTALARLAAQLWVLYVKMNAIETTMNGVEVNELCTSTFKEMHT